MILSDGSCNKDIVRNKRINKRKLPQLSSLGMTIYFSNYKCFIYIFLSTFVFSLHIFPKKDITEHPEFLTQNDIGKIKSLQLDCLKHDVKWDQEVNPLNVSYKSQYKKKVISGEKIETKKTIHI